MKWFRVIPIIVLFAVFSVGTLTLPTTYVAAQEDDSPTAIDSNSQNSNQESETGNRLPTGQKLQFSTVAEWIYEALRMIGAFFAWVGGYLLDISLSAFVMNMPSTAKDWGIDTVITEIWRMVRDLFNLLFIFGIIFSGFKLILGIDETGAKRTLGSIIIAALLINFSLFATQIIVDFSNIFATEMSALLKSSSENETTNNSNEVLEIEVVSVSDNFIKKINPENITTNSVKLARSAIEKKTVLDYATTEATELGVADAIVMGLTTAFTLTLVGFVFAAGAFLMFARFLYLVFLMMFSPIMFLGAILPNFKKMSSDWWHRLFNQALLGPAYLFMLYIALKALEQIEDLNSENGTLISYVMVSIVVCGFVWAALIVAKSLGGVGAAQAINIGNSWNKSIRGAVTGFAGRRTIGRVADGWDRGMEKRGVSEQNLLRRMSSNLAGKKFGGSTSWTQVRSANEKADQKRARYEEVYGSQAKGAMPGTFKGGVIQAIEAGSKPSGVTAAEQAEMERRITGMTGEQISGLLGEFKEGDKEYDKVVEHMSVSQFDSAMKAKDEDFGAEDKAKLAKKRAEFVTQSVMANEKAKDAAAKAAALASGAPPPTGRTDDELMRDSISKVKDKHQLKMLGAETLEKHAVELSQSQIEDILKNDDFTKSERDRIKSKRDTDLRTEFGTTPLSAATFFSTRVKKDKDVAKLPTDILKNSNAAPQLTRNMLKQILNEDVDKSVRDDIRTNVMSVGTTDSQDWLNTTTEGRLF